MRKETASNTSSRERRPMTEQFASLAREGYVRLTASLILATNFSYNFFVEHQNWHRSALNGITSPFNSPLFTPKFEGIMGELGAVSQSATFATVFAGLGGITAVILDNRTKNREGRAKNEVSGSVILADADGLPIFVDFARQLSQDGKLKNVVFAKTEEDPVRTPEEQEQFKIWIANQGSAKREFFDTPYWERAGAIDADAIVLNTSNPKAALEAVAVIREELGNKTATIIIVSRVSEQPIGSEREKTPDALILNPYVELANQTVTGLLRADASAFLPQQVNPRNTSSMTERRAKLQLKLNALDKSSITVFLEGDRQGEEWDGLMEGIGMNDDVQFTANIGEASVVLSFGNGDLEDDLSLMNGVSEENGPIRIMLPFDRDNEENAIRYGDGTISFERALNTRLAELLKPHIKLKMTIKERLKRRLAKGD